MIIRINQLGSTQAAYFILAQRRQGAECEMSFARYFLVFRDIGCQLMNRKRLGQKT